MIRNLWQHNILSNKQFAGTLSRLQEQNLIAGNSAGNLPQRLVRIIYQHNRLFIIIVNCEKNSISPLPLVDHHTDKPPSTVRSRRQCVGNRPSISSVYSLPKQPAHLFEAASEVMKKVVEYASRPELSCRIKNHFKPRCVFLSETPFSPETCRGPSFLVGAQF